MLILYLVSLLQEESLHGSRLNSSLEMRPVDSDLSNHADIVVVVGEVSSGRSDIDSEQINVEVISVLCLVDDRNGDGAVFVDPGSDGDLLNTALSIDADGTGTGEAEVRGKGPETGGDEVVVVVETDQCVVAGCVLSAPPMDVPGGVADGEGFVHVHGPLETLAGRLSALLPIKSKQGGSLTQVGR